MHPAIERAWKLVPKPVQDTVASTVDRVRGVTPPLPPAPDPTRAARVLIGPVNYAGQGYRWARALETTGRVSARNYVHSENNVLQYDADYRVSWRTAEHSRPWQRSMLSAIGDDFTHVLIEACFPILGGMHSGDVRKQVDLMLARGAKVAIVGHGTDVRLPSTHMAASRWSYFHDDIWVPSALLEPSVAANLKLIADLALPTFVSTAGLLVDLPAAHFLAVVVQPDKWATERTVLDRPTLRVVHAPTNPNLKGTPSLTPVVRKLEAEGLIEYRELRGIPNDEMPAVFADADVVLDQFRTGDYGVGACETMAAGRIVLAHVTDQVRQAVAERAGMALPVVETTLDTLESVLRDIADRREHYRAIAQSGPEFVRRLHDGRFSRTVLMTHFIEA